MSVVRIASVCLDSGTAVPIHAEVDIQRGLPWFTIIGLPDRRIDEARERIRSAIKNSGFPFPSGRITVSLTPSSVRKQGTGLDLAIALGVLAASGQIPAPSNKLALFGELSLDGKVMECPGLASLLGCLDEGVSAMVPHLQLDQTGAGACMRIIAVSSLQEAAEAIRQKRKGVYPALVGPILTKRTCAYSIDRMEGNEALKRGVLIALCGKHNLFLRGPAGSGKTMVAHAAAELLPPLTPGEYAVLARLQAAVGRELKPNQLQRPFRAPHCGVSKAALLGGGQPLVPGEMSLAYGGLLFIDEFPELSSVVRESLRQPLQEKEIRFSRRGIITRYPADCLVFAAMNDCPCGLTGVPEQTCRCTPSDKMRYLRRLPDPLADRFPMFFTVPYLRACDWKRSRGAISYQSGESMAATVARCWEDENQHSMFALPLSKEAEASVWQAVDRLHLSMRSRMHLERVSQTVAYLAGDARVDVEAVNEAIQYRRRRD